METLEPMMDDGPGEDPTTRHRRAGGPRSRRMAGRRRAVRARRFQAIGRRFALLLAVLAVGVGLVAIGSILLDRSADSGDPQPAVDTAESPDPAADGSADPAVPVPTDLPVNHNVVLLIRTDPGGEVATGLTLLSDDPVGGASVVFIPSATLVEVPGVGLDRLALAQQYGGTDLTVATVENALGIDIAGGILVDDRGLGTILERAGGASVTIGERLVDRQDDGTGTVAFDPGPQYLNGIRLAEFWSFRQRGESELDAFSRQQLALGAFLTQMTDDDIRTSLLDPPVSQMDTDVPGAVLDALFASLGAAQEAGSVMYQLLPVLPFGSADERLGTSYQLETDAANALIQTVMPGAIPAGGGGEAIPVQVLNGVGAPGVGQRVDQALEGLPFRIVLSDNARAFDVVQTQIVIYDETAQTLAAAEQVRAALGVGTILVSRQPQSVVDLTIVVGTDFIGGGLPTPDGP